MAIYRDKLDVREYVLFDPNDEYLDPPLQGYRLHAGEYARIEMVERRLPSEVLGLHLERDGAWLRFYNPATGIWLPTQAEREMQLEAERECAEAERERAEAERKSEKDARQRAEAEQERLAAELQRLRHEMERMRRSGDEASR